MDSPEARQLPFLMAALERPELCHILMNALEEAVKGTAGWKEWERKFKAFNKATAVRHNKELLLNGCFQGAPSQVRHRLNCFSQRFIDFKWEHFELALCGSIFILEDFFVYWDGHLGEESALEDTLKECRDDPEFAPTAEAYYLLAQAVGKEMSWCEGCDCHEAWHLDPNLSYWQKRKLQAKMSSAKSCPWMGKRSAHFALGHCAKMLERIRDASTGRWQELLLRLPPALAGKMIHLKQTMADHIASVVRPKLDFFLHIPHKVAGIFGGSLSFGEEAARQCAKECFAEWDALEDKGSARAVSFTLFEATVVAAQLRAYSEDPGALLVQCRDAFLCVQEYALGSCVGRIIEAEMSVIKHAMTTGKACSKPGLGCARQRRHQVIEVTRAETGMDWLCAHWHSRTIWTELLSHVASAAEVHTMSFAKKCARVHLRCAELAFRCLCVCAS